MRSASCVLSLFPCFLPFLASFPFFCLVFFFICHNPLPLSACLLPNEALRIKCLKDCRHFRRFGRHATVHSSLRCSSDDWQTCEEHFWGERVRGLRGGEKWESFNPTPASPLLLCKWNKSLVNCVSWSPLRRDQRSTWLPGDSGSALFRNVCWSLLLLIIIYCSSATHFRAVSVLDYWCFIAKYKNKWFYFK